MKIRDSTQSVPIPNGKAATSSKVASIEPVTQYEPKMTEES